MTTDADQEARDEQRRARSSPKLALLTTMQDGSAPGEEDLGEHEFDQPRWIRHHRPERAAAEGEPVLGE